MAKKKTEPITVVDTKRDEGGPYPNNIPLEDLLYVTQLAAEHGISQVGLQSLADEVASRKPAKLAEFYDHTRGRKR